MAVRPQRDIILLPVRNIKTRAADYFFMIYELWEDLEPRCTLPRHIILQATYRLGIMLKGYYV